MHKRASSLLCTRRFAMICTVIMDFVQIHGLCSVLFPIERSTTPGLRQACVTAFRQTSDADHPRV